jgi:YHS domain-containing protein
MTPARRQRKLRGAAIWAKAGLGLLVLAGLPPLPAGQAATTEAIVVDPHRGLALSGFDPVAYFTDSKPLMGRGDLEYAFAGVTWRFRSEGNRAAFAEHPEVYLPVFGGHDPMAVGRGVATPGHPQIWLIAGQRLYLFYSAEAQKAFSAAPETLLAAAERKWPDVLRTISP